MNKFFTTALASTLVCATGFASETEWPELDRELEALSSTLSTLDGGPSFGGWLITTYDSNSDTDTGDFDVSDVRLDISGSNGDYGYHVTTDMSAVVDAYATFGIGGLSATMGAFRAPTLTSALIDRNQTFFIDRSALGGANAGRDGGLMVNGDMGTVGWALAVQDGSDGPADDYNITGRVAMDLMGDGAGSTNEGAYGAGDGTCLSIALAFSDDGASGADATYAEAYFTSGQFSGSVEMVDTDAASPTAITVTYAFTGNWELGVRIEDADDGSDDTMTIGVNKYVSGHDIKWQVNMDDRGGSDTISVGLAVGF